MNCDIRASVAMAVYNGERFIMEQIDSILSMLGENDELIISYEQSDDNTLQIIKDYEKEHKKIHVVYDAGHSVESNFNNAVSYCEGKYIFLADQDDVWINNKIDKMVSVFESSSKIKVVISDGYLTDKDLEIKGCIFEEYHTSANAVRNFVKGSYLGCQMAFHQSIKNKIWPVSTKPPLPHDLWLGVLGALYGTVFLLEDKLIMHRLHENNYSITSRMKFLQVIQNRIYFAVSIFFRVIRNKRMADKF